MRDAMETSTVAPMRAAGRSTRTASGVRRSGLMGATRRPLVSVQDRPRRNRPKDRPSDSWNAIAPLDSMGHSGPGTARPIPAASGRKEAPVVAVADLDGAVAGRSADSA